jgi:hypothetical protein
MSEMEDDEQLKLLSIFHYILGGLSALMACFPLIHLAVGIAIVTNQLPGQQNGNPPPQAFGWFFIVIASAIIIIGWAYAICLIVAGWQLRRRRAYVYCLVMAALSCALVPLGTCLGVFTLVVLQRPSVKVLFQREKKRAALGPDFD